MALATDPASMCAPSSDSPDASVIRPTDRPGDAQPSTHDDDAPAIDATRSPTPHTCAASRRVLVVEANADHSLSADLIRILGHLNDADTDTGGAGRRPTSAQCPPTTAEATETQFSVDTTHDIDTGLRMIETARNAGIPYALAFIDAIEESIEDVAHAIHRISHADPEAQLLIYGDDKTILGLTEINNVVVRPEIDDVAIPSPPFVLREPLDQEAVQLVALALVDRWSLRRTALDLEAQVRGLEHRLDAYASALKDSEKALVQATSERRRAEDEFQYLATHDALTRLANRVLLHDRLRHSIEQARRYQHSLALVSIDLDHFKTVNERHGHATCDRLLNRIAQRLQKLMRRSDTVARTGGDEFAIIVERVRDEGEARLIAGRILEAIGAPFDVDGRSIVVTGSVGVSIYPQDGDHADVLLREAEAAVFAARNGGGGRIERGSNLWANSSLNLRNDLCQALETDGLQLVYQPVVAFSSGHIVSMEALIRWHHPTHGNLPPLDLVRVAETEGLMPTLGTWVLDRACATFAGWHQRGIAPDAIAVNVSAHQLHHGDFADSVQRVLSRHRLRPHQLELELTETAATEDLAASSAALRQLSALGVRVVIDDFGAGFSSLRRLREFAVRALKIDRYFTENIAVNVDDAEIVAAIIAMARSLGLEVVVEGVETMAQVDVLREIEERGFRGACSRVQGYLIARPLWPEQAEEVLSRVRGGGGFDALVSQTADILAR
ncbi:MAG: bifunctional diguanylate cyclase/phosphodiesterase [Deltaproteobacteria bacterium]|nr:bifunctional diguanylate cyclase/phosphodiesterase [Deltaproteobacteria bacterium]